MVNVKKITADLYWIGADDRRLALFEGVYHIPKGVSYNSYLLLDETTVLFDTVDKAVARPFFENLSHLLDGRDLDYVVVHHMEPDHTAVLIDLLRLHPETVVVCNKKAEAMLHAFFPEFSFADRIWVIAEGDTLSTGRHEYTFYFAPMVHWPEVTVSYDSVDKILFSADAFGHFGALNGAIFADEVSFERDYMDEARRYYANIVGKYGPQVAALLKKADTLDIRMICPLHGFVHRKRLNRVIEKYRQWAAYRPEDYGVMIAYASIYGNTEAVVNSLAGALRDRGVPVELFDVSVTAASEIVSSAFRWSHLVFASPTYNNGVFVSMEAVLHDLAAHNLQNRKIALIENGSWAPVSASLMKKILEPLKNTEFIGTLTVRSSLPQSRNDELSALADTIAASVLESRPVAEPQPLDPAALFRLSYGLYVLSVRDGSKDNACIVNTPVQITDTPKMISVAVNKENLTCSMIEKTGRFALSVLSESAPMDLIRRFGFQSGSATDKFEGLPARRIDGLLVPERSVNAVLCATVVDTEDRGTHLVFTAEVTGAEICSDEPSMTYAYYHANVKPKPKTNLPKKGYVCKICGYVYPEAELPADYICPVCKHGAVDFEAL